MYMSNNTFKSKQQAYYPIPEYQKKVTIIEVFRLFSQKV